MRKLLTALGVIAVAAGLAFATVGPYPSVGLYWFDNVDPTLGAGMTAPLNQLLIRTDVPSVYYKSGAANTAWTKIGNGTSSGGTVTSVACGIGLSCAPSPIVGAGTVSLDITPTTCAAGAAETATASDGTSTCTAFTPSGSISGTTNTISKFTSASTVGNSAETDDGTTFAVNVNKFTVTESNGDASIAGTLGVTGLSTLTGGYNSSAGPAKVGKISGTVQSDSTTGTINNFVINDTTTHLLYTGAGNVTYNGFKCGASDCSAADSAREIWIDNASNSALTLALEAAGSVATNRFVTPGSAKLVITPNGGALIRYSGTLTRWHVTGFISARFDAGFQFTSTLDVSGAGTYSGPLTLQSSSSLVIATTFGHIRSTGTAVVPTSCGTSPTINNSTDIAGVITIGATGTGCTVPFGGGYTNKPSCNVTFTGAGTGTYTYTSGSIVVVAAAGTEFVYQCIGLI